MLLALNGNRSGVMVIETNIFDRLEQDRDISSCIPQLLPLYLVTHTGEIKTVAFPFFQKRQLSKQPKYAVANFES